MLRKLKIDLVSVTSPNHYSIWNPLSIQTLAGDLRGRFKERVRVRLHKVRSTADVPGVARDINNFSPHIIGLSPELGSLSLTDAFVCELNLSSRAAGQLPLLVFGNKLPTYYPQFFVDRYKGAIVVTSEGEESVRGLVEFLLGGRPLETIPNLVFQAADGNISVTARQTPNLGELIYPPSLDLLEPICSEGSTALVQSSRGCSWGECSYCTVKSFRYGRKWEGLPLKRVIANLEQLIHKGVREFEFADDDFLGGRKPEQLFRAHELASALCRIRDASGVDLRFRIFLLPTEIYRENNNEENTKVRELLGELKNAGLARVYFGVESGSISQLKRYQRGTTVRDIEGALRTLIELDIDIDVGFIMFDPDATLDEVVNNIRFFNKWGLIRYNQWPFRSLALNRGAKLCERLKDSGRISGEDIDFMAYSYRFSDKRVENLVHVIDAISKPSRNIFYALKQKTKRNHGRESKSNETKLAQTYVEESTKVYLDLMEWLCENTESRNASRSKLEAACKKAIGRTGELVRRIERDIAQGLIKDMNNFLINEIRNSAVLDSELMWRGLVEKVKESRQ